MANLIESIISNYRQAVQSKHPSHTSVWPIISGSNTLIGEYGDYLIVIFKHTGNSVMVTHQGLGELKADLIGHPAINSAVVTDVRKRLEKFYSLASHDGIFFIKKGSTDFNEEINYNLKRHEAAIMIRPKKIFLSHKSIDKERVRDIKETLVVLGFDPWLDEDAMAAGTNLDRGLLEGFQQSCAAVFFVTPNFTDDNYLATEVDYAIREKTARHEFVIITMVYEKDGKKGSVPDLIRRFVWKEPKTDLAALREILKALPIQVGDIMAK
ncbi:MAG: toll/interleukin-1 receptor domain-containing protein [Magnetococcus sp. YQC-5]